MRLFAFDTEDDGRANFLQGAAFDGSRFFHFETREAMGAFIARTRARFYTFNLEYDLVSLYWPDLSPVAFWRSNGRILSARVGVASLFDLVWSMGGVGMAFCASLIGERKLPLAPASREYLENDVRVTWRVLERLAEELEFCGAGAPTGTLAGAALKTFRAFGGDVDPLPPLLDGFARAAYYGGRTECFDFRERVVNGFDVNSMFPAAMLSGEFPAGPYRWTRSLDERAVLADATVDVPDCHVPPLPHRDERLIFPVGRFRGAWAGEELAAAVAQGARVVRLHRAVRADRRVRPFSVFCGALFQRRARDAFSNYYAKRLMNSLYGKMAQNGVLEYVTGTMAVQVVKPLALPRRSYNPLWSAIITARARVALGALLLTAGPDLVYCDTDSVFASPRVGFKTGAGIGELKLEHERVRMRVLAPKFYRLRQDDGPTLYRARGVHEAVAREFYELGRATHKKPLRLREAIRRNLRPNVWAEIEKSFGADGFEKRERLTDGRTRPLRIGG